jgi:hypothetical protein
MGGYAAEATKREICNHHIAWTTDHLTGADKATYTTVTTHWIDDNQFLISKFSKGQPPARESTKMLWQIYRNIRVKLKTLLYLTQLASRILQEKHGKTRKIPPQ